MDALTDKDIDRIFSRIEEQIDLSKIKTKEEFFKAIKSHPRNRRWNRTLNDFFWSIHANAQKIIEDVPEIKNIPAKPREKLTRIEKRRETISLKRTINVRQSLRQRAYVRVSGRRWVGSEINFAKNLKRNGLTYKQISIQLKRSPSSVSTKLSRIR